jgi:hypothetical protein
MRSNIEGSIIAEALLLNGNRFGVSAQTLTGTTAIPPDAPHVLAWDPGGGAREVNLPASPQTGDWFFIINTADAAEVITLEDSASAALTPACTFTQNEVCFVVYTGAGWRFFVGVA